MAVLIKDVVAALVLGAAPALGGCAATCEAAAAHVRECADDAAADAGVDDDADSPAERADDVKTTCDAVPEVGRGPLADCLVAATCEDIVAAPDPVRLCAADP